MPLRSTSTLGFLMRSLSQSKLSSPPAMTQASSPCCCKQLLRISRRARLKQIKGGHHVSYYCHSSLRSHRMWAL